MTTNWNAYGIKTMMRTAAMLIGITVISSPISVFAQMPAGSDITGLPLAETTIPNELEWGIQLIIGALGLGVLILGLTILKIIWDHFRYKKFSSAVDSLSGDELDMSVSELESLKVQMYIADQNGDGLSFKCRLKNATEYVLEIREHREVLARADQAMRKQLQTSLDSGSELADWEKAAIKKYEDEAAFNLPIDQAIDRMKAFAEDKPAGAKYLTAKSEVYRLLQAKMQAEKYLLSNEQRNILATIEAERAKGFGASIKGKTPAQIERKLDQYLKDDDERYRSQNEENRRRFMAKTKRSVQKNRVNSKQRASWFG